MPGLEEFRKHYETSRTGVAPVRDASFIDRYRSTLPAGLLEEWQISGFAGFGDGFIWLTNPETFGPTIAPWHLEPANVPFARTAWGDVFVWDGKGVRCLAVHDGRIDWLTTDLEMFFEISLTDQPFLDEVLRYSLFRDALAVIGPVAPEEMYTFVPALALGGDEDVTHVKKVKLREQLLLLAQVHGSVHD